MFSNVRKSICAKARGRKAGDLAVAARWGTDEVRVAHKNCGLINTFTDEMFEDLDKWARSFTDGKTTALRPRGSPITVVLRREAFAREWTMTVRLERKTCTGNRFEVADATHEFFPTVVEATLKTGDGSPGKAEVHYKRDCSDGEHPFAFLSVVGGPSKAGNTECIKAAFEVLCDHKPCYGMSRCKFDPTCRPQYGGDGDTSDPSTPETSVTGKRRRASNLSPNEFLNHMWYVRLYLLFSIAIDFFFNWRG